MEKGLPTKIEIPYSLVTLSPEQVNNDETGKTATRLTFPSPVYLSGGKKYAIRVYSRGDAYILKTGKESIGETKHPSLSDVFLPGNDNSRGGNFDQHLKMRLFRASFTDKAVDGGNPAEVSLRNKFFHVSAGERPDSSILSKGSRKILF